MAELNLAAAQQLSELIAGHPVSHSAMLLLEEYRVMSTLSARTIVGRDIGFVWLAIRLTVKNVWGFEEMKKRKLTPSGEDLIKTKIELRQINQVAGRC